MFIIIIISPLTETVVSVRERTLQSAALANGLNSWSVDSRAQPLMLTRRTFTCIYRVICPSTVSCTSPRLPRYRHRATIPCICSAPLGKLSNNPVRHADYLNCITDFTDWCTANFLELNVSKTKELIFDFRRSQCPVQPVTIGTDTVETS